MRVFISNPPPISIGGLQTRSLYQFTLQDVDTTELYQYAPVLEDWIFHTAIPFLSYGALFMAGVMIHWRPALALYIVGGIALGTVGDIRATRTTVPASYRLRSPDDVDLGYNSKNSMQASHDNPNRG